MNEASALLIIGAENVYRRVATAMPVLLDAYLAGQDVAADRWAFAVEIEELRGLGIQLSDLRWMVCKGLVEHAVECGLGERRFCQSGRLSFSPQSCFVLTEEGKRWIDDQLRGSNGFRGDTKKAVSNGSVALPRRGDPQGRAAADNCSLNPKLAVLTPRWDGDARQLRVGSNVVKEFKCPATNQVRIIVAFQEQAWPKRIDDPLPPVDEIEPKKRLHDTINALNRHQKSELIRFKGDGTGEGVVWQKLGAGDGVSEAT